MLTLCYVGNLQGPITSSSQVGQRVNQSVFATKIQQTNYNASYTVISQSVTQKATPEGVDCVNLLIEEDFRKIGRVTKNTLEILVQRFQGTPRDHFVDSGAANSLISM